MKSKIIFSIFMILLMGLSLACSSDKTEIKKDDPIEKDEVVASETEGKTQFVVSYLHMNRRCATCEKLEAYSKEAVLSGFAEQLGDSTLVWRTANFEAEGNEYMAEAYQLYTQSVIISKIVDGQEADWKALDKIWELVNNKEEFIAYVQAEVKSYIKPLEK